MSGKMDHFTDMIIFDAAAESDQILESVRKEWDISVSSMENEILNEAFNYIKKEVTAIRSEAGRRISQKVLENKRAMHARRKQISDDIRARVLSKIADFTLSDRYPEHLKALLSRCIGEFSGEVTVYLRPADMKYSDLLGASSAIPLTFKEAGFRLGGLIAECRSKSRKADFSFDTAMLEYDLLFNKVSDLKSE